MHWLCSYIENVQGLVRKSRLLDIRSNHSIPSALLIASLACLFICIRVILSQQSFGSATTYLSRKYACLPRHIFKWLNSSFLTALDAVPLPEFCVCFWWGWSTTLVRLGSVVWEVEKLELLLWVKEAPMTHTYASLGPSCVSLLGRRFFFCELFPLFL